MKWSNWVVLLVVSGCGPAAGTCSQADGATCFSFSPRDTGLEGQGADAKQLAMRPDGAPRGELLVFLNGSGGAPGNGVEVLRAGRDVGLHAIAVSYRSAEAVGVMCRGDDACFEPTRGSLVTGTLEGGAASALKDLRVDEGIEPRLIAALKHLATLDEAGDWLQFFDGTRLRWSHILLSGHSQGGGHAALMAKRQRVVRLLMLAAPCDETTDDEPASWISSSADWATPPERMFGLAAVGDTTCRAAPLSWVRMRIQGQDLSGGCGDAPHLAPLTCAQNIERWQAVFGK